MMTEAKSSYDTNFPTLDKLAPPEVSTPKPEPGMPVPPYKAEYPYIPNLVEDAETLGETVLEAAFDVQDRLKHEAGERSILREVKERLEMEEAEIVLEAAMEAKAKMGPLAGIATSSAAYKMALTALVNEYHDRNPKTRKQFELRRMNLERAEVNLECAKVFFSAVRNASTLKAAMLNMLST